jgi:hypothetical protein
MRRIAVILAVVAAAALPAAASGGSQRPALALVSQQPLVVRGTHFLPRESVRVTAFAGTDRTVVHVRATRTGTFVAATDLSVGRCGGVGAVAVGARGSRATLRVPLPACMPMRIP